MDTLKLKIPTGFACYTPAADRQLSNHAKTFLNKVNKAIENDKDIYNIFEKAMAAYIRSYNRASNTQTGRNGGTGDTAVRECIWSWCCRVGKELNYSECELDAIWEKHYE